MWNNNMEVPQPTLTRGLKGQNEAVDWIRNQKTYVFIPVLLGTTHVTWGAGPVGSLWAPVSSFIK